MDHICPICEKGNLSEILYSEHLEFRGKEHTVHGLRALLCDTCGETSMSVEQVRANSKHVAAVKAEAVEDVRNVSGLLYGHQVKRVREVLGLTQPEAAKVFGGGLNAFSKYERNETKQSLPMDRLLRVSMAVPDAAAWLLQNAGICEGSAEAEVIYDSGKWFNAAWNSVMVVDHVQGSPRRVFGHALDEGNFDSPNWKDVPMAVCMGWR